MMGQLKYDEVIEINGKKLSKKYIESLSKQERLDLIDPIFLLLRDNGFIYPDGKEKLIKSYNRLLEYKVNLESIDLFNNSSLATDICKYFCHSFYSSTEKGKKTLTDNFNNDVILKKIIHNRLGLGWLDADDKGEGVNEAFNLSFKMIVVQGQRSMRLVPAISIFKPNIAKYMAEKYSNIGETVGDYSCGFGGRMLGAVSAGRKYIGTDPLTTVELEEMAQYLKLKDYRLINSGSENYCGDESSIDLYWSSPPYYDQEYYSIDNSQAYNNGEDYFYDKYWAGTMKNVKYMLKPGKVFGLNILPKYTKMLEITKEYFGEPIDTVQLRTVRNHLNKTAGVEKFEPIYIYKNIK